MARIESGPLAALSGPPAILHGILQQLGEAVAMEDVIAQDEACAVVADELFTDNEGLSQTVG